MTLLFLLRTIVIVNVVIARFLYCTFIIYSAIRLSSRKCVINSVSVSVLANKNCGCRCRCFVQCLVSKGDSDTAIALLRRCSKLDPDNKVCILFCLFLNTYSCTMDQELQMFQPVARNIL